MKKANVSEFLPLSFNKRATCSTRLPDAASVTLTDSTESKCYIEEQASELLPLSFDNQATQGTRLPDVPGAILIDFTENKNGIEVIEEQHSEFLPLSFDNQVTHGTGSPDAACVILTDFTENKCHIEVIEEQASELLPLSFNNQATHGTRLPNVARVNLTDSTKNKCDIEVIEEQDSEFLTVSINNGATHGTRLPDFPGVTLRESTESKTDIKMNGTQASEFLPLSFNNGVSRGTRLPDAPGVTNNLALLKEAYLINGNNIKEKNDNAKVALPNSNICALTSPPTNCKYQPITTIATLATSEATLASISPSIATLTGKSTATSTATFPVISSSMVISSSTATETTATLTGESAATSTATIFQFDPWSKFIVDLSAYIDPEYVLALMRSSLKNEDLLFESLSENSPINNDFNNKQINTHTMNSFDMPSTSNNIPVLQANNKDLNCESNKLSYCYRYKTQWKNNASNSNGKLNAPPVGIPFNSNQYQKMPHDNSFPLKRKHAPSSTSNHPTTSGLRQQQTVSAGDMNGTNNKRKRNLRTKSVRQKDSNNGQNVTAISSSISPTSILNVTLACENAADNNNINNETMQENIVTENSERIYAKPLFPYSCIIAIALKNSVNGSLRVSGIYDFMCEQFPYFKMAPRSWKNSVRHNLSFSKYFQKLKHEPKIGREYLWIMTPDGLLKMNDRIKKWSNRNPFGLRNAMLHPEQYAALLRGELKYVSSNNRNQRKRKSKHKRKVQQKLPALDSMAHNHNITTLISLSDQNASNINDNKLIKQENQYDENQYENHHETVMAQLNAPKDDNIQMFASNITQITLPIIPSITTNAATATTPSNTNSNFHNFLHQINATNQKPITLKTLKSMTTLNTVNPNDMDSYQMTPYNMNITQLTSRRPCLDIKRIETNTVNTTNATDTTNTTSLGNISNNPNFANVIENNYGRQGQQQLHSTNVVTQMIRVRNIRELQ